MTSKPIILIDIDAPLVQWEEGLVKKAREDFPHLHTPDAGTRLTWDLLDGLNEEEREAIISVMESDGFYLHLSPVPGARQAIYEMLDEGNEVFLCSTPSLSNPTCASDKLASIDKHFGREITKRTILTQDKTLVFGDYLFDDKASIAGIITPRWTQIIFDRAYNQKVSGPRLFDWADWRQALRAADRSKELAA